MGINNKRKISDVVRRRIFSILIGRAAFLTLAVCILATGAVVWMNRDVSAGSRKAEIESGNLRQDVAAR